MFEFINELKTKRKSLLKKSTKEQFFKLVLNTSYGSSICQFFEISNMIYGNNTTAMVRSFMYLSEKGLLLQGTITDGHVYDVEGVLHKKNNKHLKKDNVPLFYKTPKRIIYGNNWAHIKPLTLGNQTILEVVKNTYKETWGNIKPDSPCGVAIADAALEHVKSIYPDTKILKDTGFTFEIKDTFDGGSFNGTAHYALYKKDRQVIVKNRGVETKKDDDGFLKRPYIAYINGEFDYDFYIKNSPADKGLDDIYKIPTKITLYPPYVKKSIIKPKMYVNRLNSFANSSLKPGDEFLESKLHKYFVQKQFHWETVKQYKSWKRDANYLINKYAYSFELFWLNEDGTFDYQKMCYEVDKMVSESVISPLKHLDKNNHLMRDFKTKQCFKTARENLEGLTKLREKLKKLNGFNLPEGVAVQFQHYDEHLYEDRY